MQHCPACGGALTANGEDLHETTPFDPAGDDLDSPANDLQDTVERLPALDMEVADDEPFGMTQPESLRVTRPEADALQATLVDPKPARDPGSHDSLGDTLVEVKAIDQPISPITFSEVGERRKIRPVDTGSKPLDFKEFTTGKEATRTPAETDSQPPSEAPVSPTTVHLARLKGVLRRTVVLAVLTSLVWIATAALMITSFLEIPVVLRLLAALPFRLEALLALPGLLLLLTLLSAAGAQHRALLLAGRPGRLGPFLRLLAWFLVAALPGLGLLLGLGGALYLITRKRWHEASPDDLSGTAAPARYDLGATDRPVGWVLLFFTLAWQEIAGVLILTHFRTYLPWL